MTHPTKILLFDGVCNLCNGAVQFVIKRDKKGLFKYAALQSQAGQALLTKYNLPSNQFNSFVYISEKGCFTKSSAALTIAKELGGVWLLFYGFIVVPKFIRDFVYDTIAKNRYKWFGRTETCMVPTAELQSRFLD